MYSRLIGLLFFFYITKVKSTDGNCPEQLSQCICKMNSVNCTIPKLDSISEDIKFGKDITLFYFQNGEITEINACHFDDYPGMAYLSLANNKIKTIGENSFDHNTKLLTLHLSFNEITSLPANLFRKLTRLKNVYLDHNRIARIESDHFRHLDSLVDVRLENNLLTYVGKDAFMNSRGLKKLYLEFNQLEVPEKDWFQVFNHQEKDYEVYLDDNKWACDCRMRDFYRWGRHHEWFMNNDGKGVSVPKCHSPENLVGTKLNALTSVEELSCTEVSIKYPVRGLALRISEGKDVYLACNGTGLPIPTVTITDPAGHVLSSDKGSTIFQLSPTATSDSGQYKCVAQGFVNEGSEMEVTEEIRLSVYQSPGHIAATVFLSLFLIGVGVGLAVLFYKRRYGNRAAYGRLPDDPIHYERKDVTASATYNAHSIRTPAGEPPTPQRVNNPYLDSTDSEDGDDKIEFSKDTEFLV